MNSSKKPEFERLLQALWIAGLVGPLPVAIYPIFADLQQIQSMPVYLFSILIWLAAFLTWGVLVFSRWDRVTRFPDTWLSGILFAAGIVCYLLSVMNSSVFIATAGWVLLSGAWMATHLELKDDSNWRLLIYWPAVGTLVQLPDFLETKIVFAYKQSLAAAISSLFDGLSVPFRHDKLAFEFAQSTLSMDEVLVNSLSVVWMMFVSCLLVAWLRRPLALLPAYLSIAVFWTFGLHLMQFAAIVLVRQRFELDFSTGWSSIMLTATSILVAVGLLFSSDRLLHVLFMPIPLEDSPRGMVNPITCAWNRVLLSLAADPCNRN